MTAIKYRVELTQSERASLTEVTSRGRSSARKVKRALALLRADEGLSDPKIAAAISMSADTIARVRKRFVTEGLPGALNERPRPGQKRKLTGKQEAHLIAIACSDPPQGHTHWTLQLLADRVVAMEFADSISLETVRQVLKKTNSSHGRTKSGASPK